MGGVLLSHTQLIALMHEPMTVNAVYQFLAWEKGALTLTSNGFLLRKSSVCLLYIECDCGVYSKWGEWVRGCGKNLTIIGLIISI